MQAADYVLSVTPPIDIIFSESDRLSSRNAFITTSKIKRGTYNGSPATLILFTVNLQTRLRIFEYNIEVEVVQMKDTAPQTTPASTLSTVPATSGTAASQISQITRAVAHGANTVLSKASQAGDTLFKTAILPGWHKTAAMTGWKKKKGQMVDIAAAGPYEIQGPDRPIPSEVTQRTACAPTLAIGFKGVAAAGSGHSNSTETTVTLPTTESGSVIMRWDPSLHRLTVAMSGSPEGRIGAPRLSVLGLVIPHSEPVQINMKYVGASTALWKRVHSHCSPLILTTSAAADGNSGLVTCGAGSCTPNCSEFGPAHMTPAVWKTLLAKDSVADFDGELQCRAWVSQLRQRNSAQASSSGDTA